MEGSRTVLLKERKKERKKGKLGVITLYTKRLSSASVEWKGVEKRKKERKKEREARSNYAIH